MTYLSCFENNNSYINKHNQIVVIIKNKNMYFSLAKYKDSPFHFGYLWKLIFYKILILDRMLKEKLKPL